MTFDDWNGSVSVIRIYIHRIYNTHRIYTLDNGLLGNNSTYVTIREKRKRKKRNKTKQKRKKKQRWNRCAQLSLSPLGETQPPSFLSSLFPSFFPRAHFFTLDFPKEKRKNSTSLPRGNNLEKTFRNERYEARVGSPGIRREGGPSMKLRTRRQSRPPVTQYMSRGGSRGNKKNRSTSTVTISYPSFFPARYLL